MYSLNWQGELNRYLASAYKNWMISKRNVFTLFEVFFWPLINLLSIGLLTRFLRVDEFMVSFLLVGSIALTILQVAQMDVAYVLLFDMWSKSIKNTFIAPVHSRHLIFGSLLFGIMRGSIVFAILATISFYFFGFKFQLGGLLPPPIFLAGAFSSPRWFSFPPMARRPSHISVIESHRLRIPNSMVFSCVFALNAL